MKKQFIYLFTLANIFSCTSGQAEGHETEGREKLIENNHNLSDDSLLTMVQKQTFKYFWDGAEPHSGLSRERIHIDGEYPLNDKNVVTIGGSGFGLMAILVGIHNNFITEREGEKRINRALSFLGSIDRFHGAWAHWYDGPSGKTKTFSDMDDGGDIVETAFLVQALITIREFYKDGTESQKQLAQRADSLWKGVDWDFYRNGKDVLYWHWSPNFGWGMNHAIHGFDECLIAYILAVSSPTHATPVSTYHKGWARNGEIRNASEKYGISTVVKHNAKESEVGPLFWSHYSFLGLNPRGLSDRYANYENLVLNHTKINIAYAENNPKNFKGYGAEKGWGWSASYSTNGYNAHHPDNDLNGVIAPTAALSSIAYTPKESINFMRYLIDNLGPKVWGKYGFYDAYSETENWFPRRYLAIDQGPIIIMIQNYKDQFIWNLFMQAPDIREGLTKLGFEIYKP